MTPVGWVRVFSEWICPLGEGRSQWNVVGFLTTKTGKNKTTARWFNSWHLIPDYFLESEKRKTSKILGHIEVQVRKRNRQGKSKMFSYFGFPPKLTNKSYLEFFWSNSWVYRRWFKSEKKNHLLIFKIPLLPETNSSSLKVDFLPQKRESSFEPKKSKLIKLSYSCQISTEYQTSIYQKWAVGWSKFYGHRLGLEEPGGPTTADLMVGGAFRNRWLDDASITRHHRGETQHENNIASTTHRIHGKEVADEISCC